MTVEQPSGQGIKGYDNHEFQAASYDEPMPRKYVPGPFLPITAERINKLPKWARNYLHEVSAFVGAEEVQEIFFLRDQNRSLIKLVGELKAENRRLQKKIGAKP